MHTNQAHAPSTLARAVQWNEDAGNSHKPLGTPDLAALATQMAFVSEEFVETTTETDALRVDTVAAVKELADLIFTSAEAMRRLGFDPDVVMDLVCDSNDSKFCASAAEVEQALVHFSGRGIKTEQVQANSGLIVFISAKDQTIGQKFYKKGKVLKSPCYYKAEPAIAAYADVLGSADHA